MKKLFFVLLCIVFVFCSFEGYAEDTIDAKRIFHHNIRTGALYEFCSYGYLFVSVDFFHSGAALLQVFDEKGKAVHCDKLLNNVQIAPVGSDEK